MMDAETGSVGAAGVCGGGGGGGAGGAGVAGCGVAVTAGLVACGRSSEECGGRSNGVGVDWLVVCSGCD